MEEITTSTIPQWTYSHVRDCRAQTLLARLRIGHTYLRQRYLLTRDPQPYCDDCLVLLTVRHLLIECPSFIELRHHYFYRCLLSLKGRRWTRVVQPGITSSSTPARFIRLESRRATTGRDLAKVTPLSTSTKSSISG
ncbi:hypothetical protein E2C01_053682 [Portunus trituberculatus]|uniref:Uncharacterized protein n=1 Tax=Portunus trituberculatus TaxID=210409 RepID=A0A5B7GRH0_PORTR|nr:hypothetical protein [Portunus trituberculatus]